MRAERLTDLVSSESRNGEHVHKTISFIPLILSEPMCRDMIPCKQLPERERCLYKQT